MNPITLRASGIAASIAASIPAPAPTPKRLAPRPRSAAPWAHRVALLAARMLLLCGACGAWAAAGLVTMLDGDARLVHAQGAAEVIEALKLPAAALLQTSASSRLLRVEWPDGSALDLGADTQVLIVAEGLSERAAKAPGAYLLRGWAKLSGAAVPSAPMLQSAVGELPPFKGVAVVFALEGRNGVFSETGPLLLQERTGKTLLTLQTGQFYSQQGGSAGQTEPRPPPDMLQQLPRAFRDTLPHRLAAMQQREAKVRSLPLPTYAELKPWLAANDPALRRVMVHRFAAWAKDAGLKSALVININAHREWASLVIPKPVPKPNTDGAASAAR